MARTLSRFPTAPSSLTKTEKAVYPWEQWLDGRVWKLVQGEDFFPHPLMMERIIRTRATGRGAKVRLRHEATDKEDENNPFGIILLQRSDVAEKNIPAGQGRTPIKKVAPAAKVSSNGAAAKRTVAAKSTNGRKPVAKKAPAKRGRPAKATQAATKTKPRTPRVTSKTAAKKVTSKTPSKRAPRKVTA